MEKKWSITAGIAIVISLALLIIPKFFPICAMMVETAKGGAVPMRCFYTYQAEFLISLVSLLVAGALFFLKGGEARRLAGLFLILLGAITILLPQSWVIGICADAGAPCRLTTIWTIGAGLLLILAGGYAALLASKSGVNEQKEDDLQDAADHQA